MEKMGISRSSRPVAIWLLVGVFMLVVQILLGGITRLTGSGLSITEWSIVTGTLPPLNQQEWMQAFTKYQQTPQYHLLNSNFTLSNFKFIFFWEWFHRLWARLIAVVFMIPFIVFLVRKQFSRAMVKPMIILFLLGALQGAVGWIMVASGLTGDAIYVKPTRLALHFIFALGLLSYTFWFALKLLVPESGKVFNPAARMLSRFTLLLLIPQLIYGALMAGNKAANAAPTWPDINGQIIPSNMTNNSDASFNLLGNPVTIQFIHRGLAYLLFILIILLTIQLFKTNGSALYKKIRILPIVLVSIQVILGILAVLKSIYISAGHWGLFEWLAQAHQFVAIGLLLSLISIVYLLRRSEKERVAHPL